MGGKVTATWSERRARQIRSAFWTEAVLRCGAQARGRAQTIPFAIPFRFAVLRNSAYIFSRFLFVVSMREILHISAYEDAPARGGLLDGSRGDYGGPRDFA